MQVSSRSQFLDYVVVILSLVVVVVVVAEGVSIFVYIYIYIYISIDIQLMHILFIGKSFLQGESNRLCSHKALDFVDNDCGENLVPAVDVASRGVFEAVVNRREVLEHRHVEVMLIGVPIRRQ